MDKIFVRETLETPKRSYRLYGLIAPVWACVVDAIVTAVNQPEGYWQGELYKAREGNPIGGPLMEQYAYALFGISAIWLIIIAALGSFLPRNAGRVFTLFVVLAHTWGAGSWISSNYGFWWVILIALVNASLFIGFDNLQAPKPKIIKEGLPDS